ASMALSGRIFFPTRTSIRRTTTDYPASRITAAAPEGVVTLSPKAAHQRVPERIAHGRIHRNRRSNLRAAPAPGGPSPPRAVGCPADPGQPRAQRGEGQVQVFRPGRGVVDAEPRPVPGGVHAGVLHRPPKRVAA